MKKSELVTIATILRMHADSCEKAERLAMMRLYRNFVSEFWTAAEADDPQPAGSEDEADDPPTVRFYCTDAVLEQHMKDLAAQLGWCTADDDDSCDLGIIEYTHSHDAFFDACDLTQDYDDCPAVFLYQSPTPSWRYIPEMQSGFLAVPFTDEQFLAVLREFAPGWREPAAEPQPDALDVVRTMIEGSR